MGNTPSVPRSTTREGHFEELVTNTGLSTPTQLIDDGRNSRLSRRNGPQSQSSSLNHHRGSFYQNMMRRRPIRSMASQTDSRAQIMSRETVDEQEHRPLVHTADPEAQGIANNRSTTLSTQRRRSTMSRLSSIFLPDTPMQDAEEHDRQQNSAHESVLGGNSSIHSQAFPEQDSSAGPRISFTSSVRQRLQNRRNQRMEQRRMSIRGSIRGPLTSPYHFDQSRNESLPTVFDESRTSNDTGPELIASQQRQPISSSLRDSLFRPLSSLFGHRRIGSQSSSAGRPSAGRPTRVTFADDSDQLLPPLTSLDHRLDLDDAPHELDAVEPETRNVLSGARVTSGMSTIRRFPSGLRPRSTRLLRRGEHPPLSHVLQLAAAAIAAQLSGHTAGGNSSGRPLGGEAFDGSIQNFVQTLQDAASAQAGENIDVNATEGDLPPVNFMRVFQFPNDENGTPLAPQSPTRDADQMDVEALGGNHESDRSVTLVLVGVRSMPHGHEGSNGENGTLGPSLDTLLSLPFLPPANVLRNGASGALFRRADARARPNHRRHSMTNFSFPAQYESQRHQRTRTGTTRSLTDQNIFTNPTAGDSLTPVSESPPGPHPPPSTPADIRSGHATPIRRPSSASAVHSSVLPDLDEDQSRSSLSLSSSSAPALQDTPFTTVRQRRRSDSEFARRPELGSGAARRNGVVEPDHPPMGVGRSWLIYVVGTNVSPDHPAFTMPSLFTDNPSYEDMQMLSTLLGPVKPPVATHEDVNSAGGVFRLVLRHRDLVAEPISSDIQSSVELGADERCLICLGEYEVSEELRQLNKCRHVFHRECIDEWLLTGRNSCPMCRGPGVGDKGYDAISQAGSTARNETD